MKLPPGVESAIQALENEMARRGRELRMMQAGPERFRSLRMAVEDALRQPGTCLWTPDPDGHWDTGCDNRHILLDGAPADNHMAYCCYCGKTLVT